jgi:hypothetical protein
LFFGFAFDCVFCAEGEEKPVDVLDKGGTIEGCYGLGVIQSEVPRTVKVRFGMVCRIRRNNGL